MGIERTEPMKIQHALVINLCRRELKIGVAPTPEQFCHWGNSGGHFTDLTLEQARYILDNPTKYFGE